MWYPRKSKSIPTCKGQGVFEEPSNVQKSDLLCQSVSSKVRSILRLHSHRKGTFSFLDDWLREAPWKIRPNPHSPTWLRLPPPSRASSRLWSRDPRTCATSSTSLQSDAVLRRPLSRTTHHKVEGLSTMSNFLSLPKLLLNERPILLVQLDPNVVPLEFGCCCQSCP